MQPDSSSKARFEDLVTEFNDVEGVTPPRGGAGFGRSALRYRGKIFAMLVRGRLVVKLAADRVAALVAAGHGGHFDANKGTPMREWFTANPESAITWSDLAAEALAFARGESSESSDRQGRLEPGPQHQPADVRGLPRVLHVVVEHGHQPHRQRDRRGPAPVDDPRQVGVGYLGDQLHRLRVRRLVVLRQQFGRRGGGPHLGRLRGRVAVADVRRPGRQPEPRRPARSGPYLRGVKRLGNVVVLHPGQVPDEPADRVGAGGDLMGELGRGQLGEHVKNVLPDPAESVDEQVSAGGHWSIIARERPRYRPGSDQAGSTLTSSTVSGRRRIAVIRRSANLAGCPVRSRSTQTERSPIRAAGRMSWTQLLATWIQFAGVASVSSANLLKCARSGL